MFKNVQKWKSWLLKLVKLNAQSAGFCQLVAVGTQRCMTTISNSVRFVWARCSRALNLAAKVIKAILDMIPWVISGQWSSNSSDDVMRDDLDSLEKRSAVPLLARNQVVWGYRKRDCYRSPDDISNFAVIMKAWTTDLMALSVRYNR